MFSVASAANHSSLDGETAIWNTGQNKVSAHVKARKKTFFGTVHKITYDYFITLN